MAPKTGSNIERMLAVVLLTMLLGLWTTLLHRNSKEENRKVLLNSVRCHEADALSRLRVRAALIG